MDTAGKQRSMLGIRIRHARRVAGLTLTQVAQKAQCSESQAAPSPGGPQAGSRFSAADLDAAQAHYNQVLDISRDDLEALLHDAESAAYWRNLGQLRCADVMSREPIAVQFGTPLSDAWELMRTRKIKALPVTDRAERIVGIVTMADFMRSVDLDQHEGIGQRLRALMRLSGATHTDRPEVVGQIMTRKVQWPAPTAS